MPGQTHTLSFRLYPSPVQEAAMARKHGLLKDLWNAALEERIGAGRRGVRIGLGEQERALRVVRAEVEGWAGLVHTHEAQVVLKRLDLAFQGFFRRVRAGQTPGFSRFRSAQSFRGWGYKEHGNGFRVEMRPGWEHGHARLADVGRMRLRGRARTPSRVLKVDVIRGAFGWSLSVVVETDCAGRAAAQGGAVGLDWGVSEFATLAHEAGGFEAMPNPRHFDEEAQELRREQLGLSALARARRISRRALRLQRRALARRHAKVAERRRDFLHKLTAQLAAAHPLIATETLAMKNMTASARGTIEEPGSRVAQKAGLNRAILDTAPTTFLNMLRYKAEEAGSEFCEAQTRRLKPSQRCPDCGAVRAKTLGLRVHDCPCGCHLGRDEAAALVLLRWGLNERDACAREAPETVTRPERSGSEAAQAA